MTDVTVAHGVARLFRNILLARGVIMAVDAVQSEIVTVIARVPTEAARARLADELRILVDRYNAPSATDDEKKEIEARLTQLRRDAEIAAQVSLWSTFSMALVGVVLVVFFGGIFLYLRGMLPEPYWTIEATRPIIVFTLIVAMLGFGGLLIVRALFSNDNETTLQTRFRLAREVFLVFASVFSTVIGFYFGSGTTTAATDPPALAAPVISGDGTVSVAVSRGRQPYSGSIRLVGQEPLTLAPATARDLLSITLIPARDCPAGAKISVSDADGRTVERTIEQTATALHDAGWAGCQDEATAEANSATTANTVADNTINTVTATPATENGN